MRRFLVLSGALLLAGCSAASTPAPDPPSASPSSTDVCPASADLADGPGGFPELEGTGDGATLWALVFGSRVVATQEIKIVWRMTGGGDPALTASGPGGR